MAGENWKYKNVFENKIKQIKQLKTKDMSMDIYDTIKLVGSVQNWLYDLPKTHKENVWLRPIMSMMGSAKWVANLLQYVLDIHSIHCIKNFFTFASFMQNCSFD